MTRTSVYLAYADVERLRRLAEREGKSQTEMLRLVLDAYEHQQTPDRRFVLTGSGASEGVSVTAIPEAELFAEFGDPELLEER